MNLNATLIIEVLSFLVLLGLLIKFLYRPVLSILDKRAEEIKQANQTMQENLARAEQERQRAEQILSESKSRALKMQEKAGLEAEKLRQKFSAQTREEAARTLRACQQEITNQTQKAKEKLKEEVVALSFKVAEKILQRKFTPKDQKDLIKELTQEISRGGTPSGR